jgi:hypothetical protein
MYRLQDALGGGNGTATILTRYTRSIAAADRPNEVSQLGRKLIVIARAIER